MTDETRHEEPAPAPEMPDDSPGFLLAERAAYHLLARNAEDVVVLDLRGLSDVCDFFVLGSGQADVQVKAMARSVREGLLDSGHKPVGYEGETDGRWILLDYIDVVVHALRPAAREYYQLERLWSDGGVLPIDRAHVAGEAFGRRHPDLADSHTSSDPGEDS